MITDTQTKL